MGDFARDYAWGQDAKPTDYVDVPASFMGIRRADGRVATRNYIGIITSVNCSAHVAELIARQFEKKPDHGRRSFVALGQCGWCGGADA